MKVRIGKFDVQGRFVRSGHDHLMAMQAGMAILHIEQRMFADVITYYAVGPMFDEVDEGEITPFYIVESSLLNGEITFTFTRDHKKTLGGDQ